MFERSVCILTLFSAIGCGVIGGVFFAFSNFVMPAFARIDPAQAVAAMNAINITVINPGFMLAFLGSGGLCIALAICALLQWEHVNGLLIVAAGLIYLAGSIGVTMLFNVPLNDALAVLQPGTTHAEALWTSRYLTDWVFWNHVRSAASIVAAIMFTLALA